MRMAPGHIEHCLEELAGPLARDAGEPWKSNLSSRLPDTGHRAGWDWLLKTSAFVIDHMQAILSRKR